MATTEFGFVPQGEDYSISFDHFVLNPCVGVLIENFAWGERQVLAIGSKKHEADAKVSFFADEDFPDVDALPDNLPEEDLPPAIASICIGPGLERDIEYDDGDGNVGFLRVKNVSGGSITNSAWVPESLYFPN